MRSILAAGIGLLAVSLIVVGLDVASPRGEGAGAFVTTAADVWRAVHPQSLLAMRLTATGAAYSSELLLALPLWLLLGCLGAIRKRPVRAALYQGQQ
jgi:hypothetical protein